MPELRKLQESFLSLLLGKESNIIDHITSTADTHAEQRLNIYSSGYRLRFKEALMTDFDRLYGYLGDDLFEQLMNDYIDRYPSKHTSLRFYSQHMVECISSTKPFSDIPELVEITQIEIAFNHSFDAADCNTVEMTALAEIEAESWPSLKFDFHSSISLVDCTYNSFPIWKALSEETIPPELNEDKATWMVWRKDLVSRYKALSEVETVALKLALDGSDFSQLCEGLLDFYDEEEIPQHAIGFLQTWLSEKMICNIVE